MYRRFYYIEDDDHVYVSFHSCDICRALVETLRMPDHMEWHKEHGDRND